MALAKLSDQPPISDVTGTELFPVIVTPDSPTDPHVINATALAYSTALFNAFKDHLEAVLSAGSGVAPLSIDPATGLMTISATGGGGSWDAEQTRDTIGAAAVGALGRITVVPNDAGDLIVWDLDPAVIADITNLKAARSLIQAKENAATGGAGNFMVLPGGAGNYVSTPNNAAYNFAGDMGVAVRVKMPASAPSGTVTLAARWGSSNAFGSWRFQLRTTGQLEFVSTVDGVAQSAPITTAATPLAFDGNWIWLRATRQSSTGNVDFYTAADTGSNNVLPASWTTFQLNRATTAGALWNNGGALSVSLSVGAYNAGSATEIFTGSIGRVIVMAGEAMTDTVVADANAADYTTGTTWTGPAGRTWTLNGTATITLVGGGATFSSTSKFVLADTDAFSTVALAHRDVMYWSARGGFINTSGSARTFTPELVVNSVILSTGPAISLASSAAGTVYRWECALTIEINSTDGTTQDYQWTLRIYDAATGTFLGSSSWTAIVSDTGGGNAVALSTYTSVPKIELKVTMSFSATTVGAGAALSKLSLQKA
jgi:hypothetical protein